MPEKNTTQDVPFITISAPNNESGYSSTWLQANPPLLSISTVNVIFLNSCLDAFEVSNTVCFGQESYFPKLSPFD